MQALRRTTGTAASLLRCALQPGAVGASRRAAAPLQMHFVRWMVAKLNKSPSHPVDLALTMLRAQDKAKFDERCAPPPPSLRPRCPGRPGQPL